MKMRGSKISCSDLSARLERNLIARLERTGAPVLSGASCWRLKADVKSAAVHMKSARVDSMKLTARDHVVGNRCIHDPLLKHCMLCR